MSTLDIVASVFLVLGSLMSLLAGIAVLRFPDTMSRIHAATKPQVLGIILLMVGLGLRLGSPGVIGMLVLIVILQFVTAPVSAHLTVRVAYRNAKGEDERATEQAGHSAADDGPEQMVQAMFDENTADQGAGSAADRTAKPSRHEKLASSRAAVGSVRRMSEINELSNSYVAAYAAVSPMMATFLGVPGEQDKLDDLSPQGLAQGNELVLSTLSALAAATSTGADDDIAREVLVERLEVERDLYDSGWAHASLNVIASPLQHVRLVFDLMPTETDYDVAVLARRMAAVPEALSGYRQSLLLAAAAGRVAAVRQVDKCAEQCDTYAGVGGQRLLHRPGAAVNPEGARGPALTAALVESAAAADAAYASLGTFLRTELRPLAPDSDAVGPRKVCARLSRLPRRRHRSGGDIRLGMGGIPGHRGRDARGGGTDRTGRRAGRGSRCTGRRPAYQVTGLDALQAWMQNLSDRAVSRPRRQPLRDPRSDQDPGVSDRAARRRRRCLLHRPERRFQPARPDVVGRRTRSGGVLHLAGDQRRLSRGRSRPSPADRHRGPPPGALNDYQRLLAGTSAHAEGWALYAERLVRELGYLADDGATARAAGLPAVPGGQGDRGHRHAPGIGDPGRHRIPRGRAVDRGTSGWNSC